MMSLFCSSGLDTAQLARDVLLRHLIGDLWAESRGKNNGHSLFFKDDEAYVYVYKPPMPKYDGAYKGGIEL